MVDRGFWHARPYGHKDADDLATEQQEQQYSEWRRGRREKERERYPVFNEVIPDFQHAVTFVVLSSSEIYFQAFYRTLIYPVSPTSLASDKFIFHARPV